MSLGWDTNQTPGGKVLVSELPVVWMVQTLKPFNITIPSTRSIGDQPVTNSTGCTNNRNSSVNWVYLGLESDQVFGNVSPKNAPMVVRVLEVGSYSTSPDPKKPCK